MRILVTNLWMGSFGKSELFCLEFVKHYKNQGHQVQIYAIDINARMRAYCIENGIDVLDPHSEMADLHFDLVWIRHNVIPREFLSDASNKPTAAAIIYHHMSKSNPIDASLFPASEFKLADRLVARTHNVKTMLQGQGFSEEQVLVVGAPLSKEYLGQENMSSALNKFLFVSNNPSQNILSAVDMLVTIGFEVRTITNEDLDTYRSMLSPADFHWADAVIATEETIPHALLTRRPIFLYNKNSCQGWLTDESEMVDVGYREPGDSQSAIDLSVSAIVAQLLADFEEAKGFICDVDREETLKYEFDYVFDDLVNEFAREDLNFRNRFDVLTAPERTSWCAFQELIISEINNRRNHDRSFKQSHADLETLKADFEQSKNDNSSLITQLENAQNQIKVLESSVKKITLTRRTSK